MWTAILDIFTGALHSIAGFLNPVFGDNSYGWAIIVLTIIIRVLLLPLAVKQTRSMRAMQKLQPKIKSLQKKYKVDRDMLKKDPETYRARKQKMNEEMMALYKEEGVNPASGCLPLVAQAPIFIALFESLRHAQEIQNATFYFFTDFIAKGSEASGLGASTSAAGWPGWLLVVLMAATMFWSQRQMMNRTDNDGNQQQKILMYVMPVFLAFVSQGLPLGVLLYWVTTNVWQTGQQAVILREVKHELDQGGKGPGGSAKKTTGGPRPSSPSPSSSDGGTATKRSNPSNKRSGKSSGPSGKRTSPGRSSSSKRKNGDHLPRRGGNNRSRRSS